MKKSVEACRHDLAAIRTGRATPSILDHVKVDYYGTQTPLNQIANVATPDPRMLVVHVYDKNAVGAVDKAIRSADLGLNPQVEGNLLRCPVPQLTEERRQELARYAHKLAEEGRIAIRNIRRDANDEIKKLEKDHEVSEDRAHGAMDEIQELTDKYNQTIDETLEKKEKEILEE